MHASHRVLPGIILSRLHKCPGRSLTCVRMKWAFRVSRSTTPAAFTTVYRINDFFFCCLLLFVGNGWQIWMEMCVHADLSGVRLYILAQRGVNVILTLVFRLFIFLFRELYDIIYVFTLVNLENYWKSFRRSLYTGSLIWVIVQAIQFLTGLRY